MKDIQVTKESFSPQKRTSNVQNMLHFFVFFRVNFCLLVSGSAFPMLTRIQVDQNKCGSGTTNTGWEVCGGEGRTPLRPPRFSLSLIYRCFQLELLIDELHSSLLLFPHVEWTPYQDGEWIEPDMLVGRSGGQRWNLLPPGGLPLLRDIHPRPSQLLLSQCVPQLW
jgi:hypothetical protein